MFWITHYSGSPNLEYIDPENCGSSSGVPETPRSYFHTLDDEPDPSVQASPCKYIAKLFKYQQIYDIGLDQNNYIDKAKQTDDNNLITELLHQQIKKDGYYGFKNSKSSMPNVIGLYYPHPVKFVDQNDKVFEVIKEALRTHMGKTDSTVNDIQKKLKDLAMAGAMAASAFGGMKAAQAPQPAPTAQTSPQVKTEAPKPAPIYDRKKTLRAIAQVESNNGRNTNHATVNRGLNAGNSAIGKYGIMSVTAKDILGKSKNLSAKYPDAVNMDDNQLHDYASKNPSFQDDIADRYYSRISRELGSEDPKIIAHSWLNGIQGTKNALAAKKDIGNHWHVLKVLHALQMQDEQEHNRHMANLSKNEIYIATISKIIKIG